jgi:hypothetical protein
LFQKLIQSSQGSNVLAAPVPKNDGFLSRDIGVSSPQLNRPIWNTMRLSTTLRTLMCEMYPFENRLIRTGTNVLHTAHSTMLAFFAEMHVSSNQLNMLICNKRSLSVP